MQGPIHQANANAFAFTISTAGAFGPCLGAYALVNANGFAFTLSPCKGAKPLC